MKVAKWCERKTSGDLSLCYYQVGMTTEFEKETIRQKYHVASFHTRCVDNDICQFEQKLADKQVQYVLMISNFFFSESK